MERYLPGAVLAICGIAVYAIGCVLLILLRFLPLQQGYPLAYPSRPWSVAPTAKS